MAFNAVTSLLYNKWRIFNFLGGYQIYFIESVENIRNFSSA